MTESASQRLYSQDAEVLGQIGAVLVKADLSRVEVRLPRPLAEQALAAWRRDSDHGPAEPEIRPSKSLEDRQLFIAIKQVLDVRRATGPGEPRARDARIVEVASPDRVLPEEDHARVRRAHLALMARHHTHRLQLYGA